MLISQVQLLFAFKSSVVNGDIYSELTSNSHVLPIKHAVSTLK